MALGHRNIGLPGVNSVRGKYKISTVVVKGNKHKIKTFNRTWLGNPLGFYYWVDGGEKKFSNSLTREGVIQKVISDLES